jgi:UDP:flavonoid glycosyltransferase YjiC (YdhE family)
MTELIFEAVKKTGQRALVSKGWGGLGGDDLNKPDGIFMLGNVPHDWLFQHVSCVGMFIRVLLPFFCGVHDF